jgi:hypothetical protein
LARKFLPDAMFLVQVGAERKFRLLFRDRKKVKWILKVKRDYFFAPPDFYVDPIFFRQLKEWIKMHFIVFTRKSESFISPIFAEIFEMQLQ